MRGLPRSYTKFERGALPARRSRLQPLLRREHALLPLSARAQAKNLPQLARDSASNLGLLLAAWRCLGLADSVCNPSISRCRRYKSARGRPPQLSSSTARQQVAQRALLAVKQDAQTPTRMALNQPWYLLPSRNKQSAHAVVDRESIICCASASSQKSPSARESETLITEHCPSPDFDRSSDDLSREATFRKPSTSPTTMRTSPVASICGFLSEDRPWRVDSPTCLTPAKLRRGAPSPALLQDVTAHRSRTDESVFAQLSCEEEQEEEHEHEENMKEQAEQDDLWSSLPELLDESVLCSSNLTEHFGPASISAPPMRRTARAQADELGEREPGLQTAPRLRSRMARSQCVTPDIFAATQSGLVRRP